MRKPHRSHLHTVRSLLGKATETEFPNLKSNRIVWLAVEISTQRRNVQGIQVDPLR